MINQSMVIVNALWKKKKKTENQNPQEKEKIKS